MHRPTLVIASDVLPVSLEAVKLALRVDGSDADAELERLIKSAIGHYQGWGGVLGISLIEQTWRQDFDRFQQFMALPIGPVQTIASVKWRDEAGQLATVSASDYALTTDAGGRASVRFLNSYSAPSGLYETGAVSVEYKAGWPLSGADVPTTPEDVKTAIILHVQKHFDEAAQTNWDVLDRVECDLIYKYRRPI
jgi:uncharacterized phiE125 gp8 family phage protein